jgi:protoporphyrinogen oxidase
MTEKLIILGAGPMGLAAAYQAAKRGYDVDVLEASDVVGGMAAHFDFDGLSIERFYHFCCLSDADTLEVMGELGLSDGMKWSSTKMGLYFDGKLYPWGDPIALLTFPKLGPIGKLRYGLQAFLSTRRKDWSKLDRINAEQWYVGWLGRRGYERMWKPLLHYKFYDYVDRISAAWIWQRIKRVGRSRKSLLEERLGYIEGGSEVLMRALADAIAARGGRIHLKAAASRFLVSGGAISGVETADGRRFEAPNVISTIPTPYIAPLLPDDQAELKAAYQRIQNIAVVCVIHKLKRSVSRNFWVNIVDKRFEIPGFIEFSNLRPLPETVVYVPYYMPAAHPKFSAPDQAFIDESWAALKLINPTLTDADRLASRVGRLRHAQPIYEPGFETILPPVQTPISGLQIADTAFYYPEDRGVSESFRFAKLMVGNLADGQAGIR